jgi:hypothetical protein
MTSSAKCPGCQFRALAALLVTAHPGRWPNGTMHLFTLLALVILAAGCNDRAARSSDDVVICKRFIAEAGNRMQELKQESFQPGDLTLEQLHTLTPQDPDWRDAQFLALSATWGHTNEAKKIVIICGQSRVSDSGQRVHCVGYNTGETAWVSQDELGKLQLREFTVLPRVRP